MLVPFLLISCALLSQALEPPTLESLEFRVLEAFDHDATITLPELPHNRELEQAKLNWLQSAAATVVPVSPFVAGSSEHIEATELLKFINTASAPTEMDFYKLSLRLSGSQLALWRFGRANIRNGNWDTNTRLYWEDCLLEESTHPIIRGYAFRHALCWALAENNEDRFADLKNSIAGQDMPTIASLFQKTFALMGGPWVPLRLWTPTLEDVDDITFSGNSIWICPAPDLPPPSKETIWIIPLLTVMAEIDSTKDQWMVWVDQMMKEPAMAGYNILLAPSQKDLEMLGLALFPALIELDEEGYVKKIRMGDACPL